MSDAFELEKVDVRPRSQEGVDMELMDPAGEQTGVILIVRGYDSRAYKEIVEAHLRKRTEMLPRKPTDAELKAEFYEEQAALLAGWKGKPLQRGGQVLAYTAAAAAEFLEGYDWVLEQVRRFAGNRRNFLPGSATA